MAGETKKQKLEAIQFKKDELWKLYNEGKLLFLPLAQGENYYTVCKACYENGVPTFLNADSAECEKCDLGPEEKDCEYVVRKAIYWATLPPKLSRHDFVNADAAAAFCDRLNEAENLGRE